MDYRGTIPIGGNKRGELAEPSFSPEYIRIEAQQTRSKGFKLKLGMPATLL
jgi:hypothetical protein